MATVFGMEMEKQPFFAFRVGFFRDFMQTYPDCILSENNQFYQLYDCVDACSNEHPEEDLDCWFSFLGALPTLTVCI